MTIFNSVFPSDDFLSTVSPTNLPPQLSIFPPKFKFRPPTAINLSSKAKPPQYQKTTLRTLPINPNNSTLISETKLPIDYCLSLLQNRISDKSRVPDAPQIHAQILKLGLFDLDGSDTIVNNLVGLYAKNYRSLDDARRLFDAIPERTVAVYAALIGSYCRLQRWVDVLSVFGLMVRDGIEPDKFLVPTILKACSGLEALRIGEMLHGFVIRKRLELDVFVGNSLIDMYAKCGDSDSSLRVFDMMAERDVVTWTALVSAYADAGLLEEAAEVFQSMQLSGVDPDLISWNTLISGFAQNGESEKALHLLEEMRDRGLKPGVNSWNGIISGCVQNGFFEDALDLFGEMCLFENPNAVTIASIIPACLGLQALDLGKEMHCYAIKREFQKNVYVGGSLLGMYSKCGRSDYAERVFAEMENKNTSVWNEMIAAYVNEGKMKEAMELLWLMQNDGLKPDLITYNTLLAGYARNGQKDEALELFPETGRMGLKPNVVSMNVLISGFQQSSLSSFALNLFRVMQFPKEIVLQDPKGNMPLPVEMSEMSIQPNAITITSALAACSDLNLWRQGKEIHAYILRNWFECNVFVSSALVDMYSKCQDMDSAAKSFHRISDKNTVSWNILMAGHNHNKKPEATLNLFLKMLEEGYIPSSITLMILLSACSSIAALRLGRELHSFTVKSGFHESAVTLASAIIDMYAKCGSILEARLVFNNTVQKDLPLWNAMISGYSMHGMPKDAIVLFKQLEASGIKPDHITFTAVLSACSHEGLVEEGWKYFNYMEAVYEIKPTLEHYTCMVGIMGGAGLLKEALDFMKKIPYEPDACMWATLLRACRVHSNLEIGEIAAKALFELEPSNASNYIVLSNIYAMTGMWDAARNVRIAMRARGLMTVRACSSIDVSNVIYTFQAGDSSHPELEKILDAWYRLAEEMEWAGYVPHDVIFDDEQDADPFSCFHTEKLAICFGIISSHSRGPVRISKNARMCIDCHTSTKLISKIEEREIFVRDGCFYHHFKDGICSCRDKW
ncbi:pentatricopeptide repeat-containing protein At5g04780, mitochondrial-like [Magnolia sinica]|uniref:pentatricopeptide repeat-containing protein At5g04780, mitochondrial-like n=1 Tax=Magnolia sinica TaxID=86752 RepID=UPI00265B4FF7|nr:pentatricopeptide repeat-containing protein At5g04780, mitochondrial-like [Magnolia sinica]